MRYFNKKRFTMRQVVGLLTIVFLGIAAITYAVSFTDFQQYTTISSSEMNSKLNALKDAINKKDTSCSGNSASDVMVKVGPLCVDKYEASIWSAADGTGTAYGVFGGQTGYPGGFPANGNWTTPVYAVSKVGVLPSTGVTWFQAQQACALSDKRLLTNAEWQMAAAGTPDPGTDNGATDCAVLSTSINTGSRSSCVSKWGVNDMVGNAAEWVADWIQGPNGNGLADAWNPGAAILASATYGNDYIGGINEAGYSSTDPFPAALIRGAGSGWIGTAAGVFAMEARYGPSASFNSVGFRCAR